MRPTDVAYKVMDRADWVRALAEGRYEGSEVDRADGYIHMSTQVQLAETLAKHYRGRGDLVVLTIDLTRLGDDVVWEPSRGGALFPHLYGGLPVSAVTSERPAAVSANGAVLGPEG